MQEVTIIMATLMGISLAAASGFRVFLPPFLLSLAARFNVVWFLDIDLIGTQFEFFTSTLSIVVLGIATVAEFAAFYAPWVDSALDTIATPASIVAGVAMTAIVLEGNEPIIQWTIAIVAGGGVAATIQSATVAIRGLSSTFTFGLGNSAVATGENVASVALTLIAILIPFLSALFVLLIVALLLRMKRKKKEPVDH
ncbi:MAG: DUF4126 domain-containing protein [Candidatus Thermoplasmatota archaeon]|mgnify:FL=1|uniref:Putative membrane protein n=3 Tax=environmental samples TaxID=68359 RepID=A0A075FXG1_9EURY|nr:putative membrane protein [uncultured marine group II/III euryarchaeote AD1000_12_E11]AIE94577.1 putative membrane protein [uncultured marine group II/III euryarchaeote AD1000_49_E03]AIE96033.1 putative membrane protein [uncultured marine group II/III euryarchaeote AD1000_71_F10]MEE3318423.1 DUF4126 domain-containing protein [Candidatus Thermoplasmatota archaeon]|tara:strand:- start:606 stop:1196 length:591 start_codon:yes stop_codon:yes gene_type:complete